MAETHLKQHVAPVQRAFHQSRCVLPTVDGTIANMVWDSMTELLRLGGSDDVSFGRAVQPSPLACGNQGQGCRTLDAHRCAVMD